MQYKADYYSRVEIIRGIAPVRPGPLWLSFSLQERARNRLCRYCIGFRTNNCDVLPHIMHKVTFTSPLTFHIFVEMYVCMSLRQGCIKVKWVGSSLCQSEHYEFSYGKSSHAIQRRAPINDKGREDPCRKTDVGRRFSCALPVMFGVTEPV